MKIYKDPFTQLNTETAVALGFFDGVHAGHAAVITKAAEYAKENGLETVIWTFDFSPKSVFSKEPVHYITDNGEKCRLFEKLGADILISFPFTDKIRDMECEEFADTVLKKCLKAKKVFCGFNYSFGAGGKGTPQMLKELCAKNGTETEILAPVKTEGGAVSSSRIREAIENGDAAMARILLGRPYSVTGKVNHGKKLGRTLGFPTANQIIDKEKVIPKDGVYLTRVEIDSKEYYGITDIGVKPTVGENERGAETYIFGLDKDLYGRQITVEFLHYLRSEKKFDGIESLKAQIAADEKKAKKLIENEKKNL